MRISTGLEWGSFWGKCEGKLFEDGFLENYFSRNAFGFSPVVWSIPVEPVLAELQGCKPVLVGFLVGFLLRLNFPKILHTPRKG